MMPKRFRRPSLRLRITAGALVIVIAAFCGAGLLVIRIVEREMLDQIDSALTADADFTERLMQTGSGLPTSEGPTDLYVQFVSAEGRVLGASTAAAGRPALAGPQQATGGIETRNDPVLGDLRVLAQPTTGNPDVTLVLARSSTSVANVRDSLVQLLVLLTVIGSIALGLLIWFVVGRALRPVDEMRRTVDAIGERDLRRRVVEPGTGDELDELAETLNDLLARLDAAVTREAQFVADASHELRTPVAGVRALLETEPVDPASVVRTRAEALARVGQLQDLVEDLLVLARSDTRRHRAPQPVDLDELVLGQARQLDRTSDLDIDTSGVSGGQVSGHDTDLGRLVENLATNAARYARTTVAFSVREVDGTVELSVADDGPGIDAEDRDRVFERFSTLEEARGPQRCGPGLGLSIASAIVAAHEGSIRVDEAVIGGARFVVRLPAHRSADSSKARA